MNDCNGSINSANEAQMNLEQREFVQFRDLLESISGIHLPTNKQYLIATRLRKLMHDNQIDSLGQLLATLSSQVKNGLHEQVVDAMTTNETFWFRDEYPFRYLQTDVLPRIAAKGSKIRIWCMACSSGQEPFSLAIAIDEFLQANGMASLPVEIVGTDLSTKMLQRCEQGIYDRLEATRGLSADRLSKYFDQLDGERWQVKSFLRNRINFRRLNLKDPFTSMGKFDVIFCRNVLIYFSAKLKGDILNRLHYQLEPTGTLFLGASEGLGDSAHLYEMVHCNPGIAYQCVQ